MPAYIDAVTVPYLGYDAETTAQAAALADARQRLQDLLAYLRRLRTAGSHEAARLREEPAQVIAGMQSYVNDVLDLIECAAGEE